MKKSSMLLVIVVAFSVAACTVGMPKAQNATINWTEIYQQIDGFGASSANNPVLRAVTEDQADLFFDSAKGAGLSLLRTQIHPDGSSTEIVTAQKAVARGALVWGSPWSPSAKYKTNENVNNGGHLLRSEYAAWAHMLAAYVKMMRTNGVPMYAISVQNEPDISIDYESCLYTPQEMHDFVPYLYSALQEAGVGSTKIMIAEDSEWRIDLAKAAIADPNVARDVGVVAAHGYLAKIQPYKTGNAHLWETEVYDREISHYDGSIAEGLRWASTIHKFLTVAGVSAWHYWGLRTDDNDNGGLTDLNGIPGQTFVCPRTMEQIRAARLAPNWSELFRLASDHRFQGSRKPVICDRCSKSRYECNSRKIHSKWINDECGYAVDYVSYSVSLSAGPRFRQ